MQDAAVVDRNVAGFEFHRYDGIGVEVGFADGADEDTVLVVAVNGAEGRTRTGTARATAPSRRRVYQFHHFGNRLFDLAADHGVTHYHGSLILRHRRQI